MILIFIIYAISFFRTQIVWYWYLFLFMLAISFFRTQIVWYSNMLPFPSLKLYVAWIGLFFFFFFFFEWFDYIQCFQPFLVSFEGVTYYRQIITHLQPFFLHIGSSGELYFFSLEAKYVGVAMFPCLNLLPAQLKLNMEIKKLKLNMFKSLTCPIEIKHGN